MRTVIIKVDSKEAESEVKLRARINFYPRQIKQILEDF